MLVDSSNSTAGLTVTGAIRQASAATGTSFNYLLATAQVESGLDPRLGASTSSARGLFQFIEQTWLATMKQAGPALGYGDYAAAITKTASGNFEVKDPALRSQILKLRNDPTANAVMAGAFTQANAAVLTQRLGREPSEGELYIAHFLGAGGAARLINLAASNPQAKAANFFAGAAHANSSIFYDRTTGSARSVAQVRDILTARYDIAARAKPDQTARTAQAAGPPLQLLAAAASANTAPEAATVPAAPVATPASARVPDTAGITSAFAAAAAVPAPVMPDRQIFHGLFQDPGRTAPVGTAVSELWGAPNSTSGAKDADAESAVPGGMLDLFKDPAQQS
jgi:Transglycosylase SLT domain